MFVLDVSLVTRVLLCSVYRSRLIRIRVNRFSSVIICLMGLSQARNQDFMWGGANEAKVD